MNNRTYQKLSAPAMRVVDAAYDAAIAVLQHNGYVDAAKPARDRVADALAHYLIVSTRAKAGK